MGPQWVPAEAGSPRNWQWQRACRWQWLDTDLSRWRWFTAIRNRTLEAHRGSQGPDTSVANMVTRWLVTKSGRLYGFPGSWHECGRAWGFPVTGTEPGGFVSSNRPGLSPVVSRTIAFWHVHGSCFTDSEYAQWVSHRRDCSNGATWAVSRALLSRSQRRKHVYLQFAFSVATMGSFPTCQ